MTDVTPTLGYRPCVGMMVINPAGLVWIGRRFGAPSEAEGPGQWWQMPQGGIDPGEEPAAAALRELREETSMTSVRIIAELPDWHYYDLPPSLQGRAWGGRYRGQRQKWFALQFQGADGEINISTPPGHQVEFEAWRWAPVSDIADVVAPFKRAVYETVVRDLGRYAQPAD